MSLGQKDFSGKKIRDSLFGESLVFELKLLLFQSLFCFLRKVAAKNCWADCCCKSRQER